MVKYTTLLAVYCCFCIMRSVSLLCSYFDAGGLPGPTYWTDLKTLDEYNLKGRLDKPHNWLVEAHFSREEYMVLHDYFQRRTF